jgi:DoxX-like family
MKPNKIIYWIATVIMIMIFAYSASMYLTKYEMVVGFFKHLGFPTWLIYPLAFAKIAGIIVVLFKKPAFLKEIAYAGFLFDALLALTSHTIAKDGGYLFSLIALIATIVSWIYDRKVFTFKNN